MGMKKGQKQYGEAFHARVREMRSAGKTRRQIAEEMGVGYEVIEKMFKRKNRSDRQSEGAVKLPPKKRGRTRIKPLASEDEYKKRIKELEMENEVLKKFHEELRRRKK